jgi:hypothetical protein
MRLFSAAFLCCLAVCSTARSEGGKQTPLDLKAQANQKLKTDFGPPEGLMKGNNLASLPAGEQTLAGVKFNIGEGMIQLSGASTPEKPKKVEAIPVGAKFSKLYILQATQWATDDGTPIGQFTVNYDDKSQETIPIVYGKNTFDWWKELPPKSNLKVAWKGTNDQVKKQGIAIRLYLASWDNPQPAKKVISIGFESNEDTPCAPFCVGMTIEE